MSAETEFFSKGLAFGLTDIDSTPPKMLWRFRGEEYETPMWTWLITDSLTAPIETIRAHGKRIA